MLQTPSVSKKLKTMQTLTSSSLSPRREHLPTPPPVVKRRRKEIAEISDPKKRAVTFCKRRKGLVSKTEALCTLTAARSALIVISREGKLHSFGKPTEEEVISEYLRRRKSKSMPPEGLTEWVDWVETELDSCATEEGLGLLKAKCETVLRCVRKKLGEVGADGHTPVVVCCRDCGDLNVDGIDSHTENFKASRPSNFALSKDDVRHGDCEGHITSPVNLAAGDGSSGAESAPVHSLVEGCAYNATSGGSSGLAPPPTCFDDEGRVFNPDDFLNLEYNPDPYADLEDLFPLDR